MEKDHIIKNMTQAGHCTWKLGFTRIYMHATFSPNIKIGRLVAVVDYFSFTRKFPVYCYMRNKYLIVWANAVVAPGIFIDIVTRLPLAMR